MAKSDCGLPANSGSTKQLISSKERTFRWDYATGKYPDMTVEEAKETIKGIREEHPLKR